MFSSPLLFCIAWHFHSLFEPMIYRNLWAHNPINKALLSVLHLFSPISPPLPLFSALSLSPSLTLGISLYVPWLTPVNIFPLQGWEKFRLIPNIMPVVDFTRNKVVDGMIKGGLGWLTKSAIFTWCGRYPSTVLHADNVPRVATAVMFKHNCF